MYFPYRIQVNKDSVWNISILKAPGSPQRNWTDRMKPQWDNCSSFHDGAPKNL